MVSESLRIQDTVICGLKKASHKQNNLGSAGGFGTDASARADPENTSVLSAHSEPKMTRKSCLPLDLL